MLPKPPELVIAVEDPRAPDVAALLASHLAFARRVTPPDDVHAMDHGAFTDPTVDLHGARDHGALLGIGALKDLGDGHGELKSMHTAEAARGRGVARALLTHLLDLARRAGMTRVSLETGSMDAFAPARALYAAMGFVECEAFGDYPNKASSTFMTRPLP